MTEQEQDAGELPDAVIAALARGRKLEAIKLLRRERHVDLKAAKDAVDRYLSDLDPSRRKRQVPVTETGAGRFFWFVVVVIATFIFYFMWGKS